MKTGAIIPIGTLTAVILSILSPGAWADSATATQTVRYEIREVALIAISGGLPLMRAASVPVTDASTTYSITSNAGEDSKKITAAIDTRLPAGVTLEVHLVPPDANATAIRQSLSTTHADVVTHIDNVVATHRTITYTLKADREAGPVSTAGVTVTYTLTEQS